MNRLEDFVRNESAHSGLAFRERAYGTDERAELVRDLLALANADARGARFLCLGVRDEAGRERALCGLTHEAWNDFKAMLDAVLAVAVEPALKMRLRTLEIEGALIGMLCLDACTDRPYLTSAEPGAGLSPGAGWVRRGTQRRPLLRGDLQRLFARRVAGDLIDASEVRVGFAAPRGASHETRAGRRLRAELTLPVLPLVAVPSALAIEKLERMLAAQANARAHLGRTETRISRLAHAQIFGADTVYEPQGEDTLRAQIAAAAERYRGADEHYALEVRAHPLRVGIENAGKTPLRNAVLTLKVPRIEGLGVAGERHPAADAPPTREGYPEVREGARAIEIRGTVSEVRPGASVAAFRQAPRLWLREPAAGQTLPVDYTLRARELSEPLRDTLLIRIT